MPFLALAAYPSAVFLAFSTNPIELRWGSTQARRGHTWTEPLPKELRDRADAVARHLNFLVDALILILVVTLSRAMRVAPAGFGLQFADWKSGALVGIAAGIALIGIMSLILRKIPIDPEHAFTCRVRRGSLPLWLAIFLAGAFSEELWVAFCIVAFTRTGHSATASISVTVLVFAATHYSYRFWGAVSVGAKETVSALLFLHFGSLVPMCLYHFVGNLGSLYWNRYWHR